jgi:hypothetical protein
MAGFCYTVNYDETETAGHRKVNYIYAITILH